MIHRIVNQVKEGELCNRTTNQVVGWIQMAGCEDPIHLRLLGNLTEPWQGHGFQFQAQHLFDPANCTAEIRSTSLQSQQFGVVGEITTDRNTSGRQLWKVPRNGSIVSKMASPVALQQQVFQVEWHGNDGRVLIEISDPVVRATKTWEGPPTNNPGDLQREDSGESILETLQAMRKVNRILENGQSIPLREFLGTSYNPLPIREDQATAMLREAVAKLALHGISYSVCPHCSMSDAYHILFREIAEECHIHPELWANKWTTHLNSAEYCPICEQENEEDQVGIDRWEENCSD